MSGELTDWLKTHNTVEILLKKIGKVNFASSLTYKEDVLVASDELLDSDSIHFIP